jgi:hypothetical protein
MYGRSGNRRFSGFYPGVPSGFRYIGPCRCGGGPHAYYQDAAGRIAHASEVFYGGYAPAAPTREDLEYELQALKDEKTALEKRLREVEDRLNRESGK